MIHEDCGSLVAKKILENREGIEGWLFGEGEGVGGDEVENELFGKEMKEVRRVVERCREGRNGEFGNLECVEVGSGRGVEVVRLCFVEERDRYDCKCLPIFVHKIHEEVLKNS